MSDSLVGLSDVRLVEKRSSFWLVRGNDKAQIRSPTKSQADQQKRRRNLAAGAIPLAPEHQRPAQ
ncbi:hypothetical protein [Mycolicibacterium hippocampi]|uniref:hypothetical protein n=1 Tax=Mycobacteriaceae TaxID=1762 RepID=UPI0015B483A8|nr:hypothetical protein [Mycolicibacterium hippocampi]